MQPAPRPPASVPLGGSLRASRAAQLALPNGPLSAVDLADGRALTVERLGAGWVAIRRSRRYRAGVRGRRRSAAAVEAPDTATSSPGHGPRARGRARRCGRRACVRVLGRACARRRRADAACGSRAGRRSPAGSAGAGAWRAGGSAPATEGPAASAAAAGATARGRRSARSASAAATASAATARAAARAVAVGMPDRGTGRVPDLTR